jgi:hypothetical protein
MRNVPANDTVPSTQINTLADILAACVNSVGGGAGDGTACGKLFMDATPTSGTAPTDTIKAILDVLLNPTNNTSALYLLLVPAAPFQPTLTASPVDFRVRLTPSTPAGYVLQLEPTAISFPDTMVNTTTAAQTMLLENKGSVGLTLGTMSLVGTNPSEFGLTDGCSTTLAAGASCVLTVTARPTSTGAQSAYVSVASSSPDSPQYVSLAVNGLAVSSGGRLSANVASLDLTSGYSQFITLTNPGTGTVTLSSMTTQTNSWLITNSTCGTSLAANATCTLTLTNVGGSADALEVVSNDPASPLWIGLGTTGDSAYVTPSLLWFGGTVVGQTSAALTATYDGNVFPTQDYVPQEPELNLTFLGPNASDFTAVGPTTPTNYCLAGYAGNIWICTYSVTFTPTAPGFRVAYLRSPAGEPFPVYGIAVSGSPGNLGWSTSGSTSTLTNYGSAATAIESVTTTQGFTQTNTCGSSLAGSASCTVTTSPSFTPRYGGLGGLLTVTTSVGTEYAPISSTGGKPTLDFGYGTVGQVTSKSYGYLTYYGGNNGMAEVAFSSATSGFSSYDCNVFRANCEGAWTYTPPAAGYVSAVGDVSLDGNGQDGYGMFSYTYNLTATGIGTMDSGPGLRIIPNATAPSYSVFPTGTGPAYMFWNSGTTTLSLTPSFTGAAASAYSVSGTNSCTTLAPMATCTINIAVTTSAVGQQSANLVFTDATSGQSWTFPQALISVGQPSASAYGSPVSITFPATQLNAESAPQSFTVSVPSEDALTTSISPATEFTATESTCARGQSPCTITVVFHPTGSGSHAATLTATDAAASWTSTTALSGSLPPSVAVVSATSLNFPSTASGTTTQLSFTLTNGGTPAFTLTAVPTSGTNAGEFYASNGCGSSVASGASCTITVTFAPVTTGVKTATVSIVGQTSAGLPITLSLYGSSY